MSKVVSRALAVVAAFALGHGVTAQQTPAPVPQVTVTGEVNHPGSINWTPQMTVQAAIDASGGLTDRAAQSFTLIHHSGAGTVFSSGALRSRVVQPGDSIEVSARVSPGTGSRVFVEGAVKSPGDYTVLPGINNVALAIAAAGGFTSDAGTDVEVWSRPGPLNADVAPIDASTTPDDVVIRHVSRSSLDSRSGLGGIRDHGAIVVPRADAATFVGGSVTVTGDVRRPGVVRADRLSLRAVLVAAGGLTSEQGRSISISHARADGSTTAGGRETVEYRDVADGSFDVPLRDGDVVKISQTFVMGGGFTSGMAGSKMQVVQWHAVKDPRGMIIQDRTAQDALTRRNAEPMVGDGPPWAPMVVADMTVERQVGDRIEVIRPTPTFVLEEGDAIAVIQRRWDLPAYPLRMRDLKGDWVLDPTRDLKLDVQGDAIKGVMTHGATTVPMAGEALGNFIVLRATTETSKGPQAPDDALSSVCVAYFGPGGGLVGRTDTIHAGVDGLHYFTTEAWHAAYR